MTPKGKLSNVFGLITCCVFLSTGINNYLLGDFNAAIFLELLAIMSLITLVINYTLNPKIAFLYLFSLITLGIFFFDSYAGVDSGSYLFYFPLSLAVANSFDYQTKGERLMMIMQLFLISLLIFINLATNHQLFENINLKSEQKQQMFKFNLIVSIICLGYFIFLIVSSNLQRLILLENIVAEETKLRNLEIEKNRDQEILMAELQHRSKNNLSLMSSLLKLKLENVNDDNYSFAYKESIHAIQTVAQANHLQRFFNGKLMVSIDIYLDEIKLYWLQLFNENPLAGEIKIKSESFSMNLKQAVPLGLIIHEIISVFWIHCLEKDVKEVLVIDISERLDTTVVKITSSTSDLIKLEKEAIIFALIEQIDAMYQYSNPKEFRFEIPNDIHSLMLESESLFKK